MEPQYAQDIYVRKLESLLVREKIQIKRTHIATAGGLLKLAI
jgi:hypothetical protein